MENIFILDVARGGWLLPESTLFVVVGCLAVIAKGACKIARETGCADDRDHLTRACMHTDFFVKNIIGHKYVRTSYSFFFFVHPIYYLRPSFLSPSY